MNEFPGELNEAFQAYREHHVYVEPSSDFMPRMWERIEARRSPLLFLRRTARLLVATSLAAALLMAVVVIPRMEKQRQPAGYYADVVATDNLKSEQEYAAASLPKVEAWRPISSEDLHK